MFLLILRCSFASVSTATVAAVGSASADLEQYAWEGPPRALCLPVSGGMQRKQEVVSSFQHLVLSWSLG